MVSWLVLCHSPSSGAEPRSVSACVHCVALHLLSVLCLASSSTLTGPRGGTTLSVGLRPLCRSTPASGPQHYSVTHRTAGQAALSVGLRPICLYAPASGSLPPSSPAGLRVRSPSVSACAHCVGVRLSPARFNKCVAPRAVTAGSRLLAASALTVSWADDSERASY